MDSLKPKRVLIPIDASLLGGILLLCIAGLTVLYSASGQDLGALARQGSRMVMGLVAMFFLARVRPSSLQLFTPWLYGFGVILLVLVLLVGSTGHGAERWLNLGFMKFQPSELLKLFVPMMAAWYLNDRRLPPNFKTVVLTVMIITVPVLLVMKQPDLGTALLIASAGGAVLFLAGLSWRLIIVGLIVFSVSMPVFWHFLHDYQRQRIMTMLDPTQDALGTGYHIIQSKIAVGSGGLYGKGWLNGSQSHLEFLPEHSTDFIFAVFCEEFGFMGVMVLLALYTFVLYRGFALAMMAKSTFGRLLAGSLVLTLFVYVFVNMGMVVGRLPVVGVPLPFISYGGTSLVTLMASLGILNGIYNHEKSLPY